MPPEKCDTTIQQVKKLISSVLVSNPSRIIPVTEFEHDYRDLIGSAIPYAKLGFSSLKNFLLSIPDVLEIKSKNDVAVVVPVVSRKVVHIKNMINKQKKSTSRKKHALAFIPPSVRNHKIVDQPHREERSTKIVIAGKKPVEKINQPGCSREVQSISTSKVTTKCPPSNKEAVIKNESVRSHKIVDQPNKEKRSTKIVIAGKKPVEKINQPGCSREVQSISTSKVTTKCPPSNKEAVIENESVRSHKIVDQPHKEKRSTKIVIAGKKPVEKINQPGCSREVQSISTSKVTTKCPPSNKEAVIENESVRSHKIVDQPHKEKRSTKIVIAGKKPVEKINQPGCSREVQSISTSKVTTKCPPSNKEAVIENESVRSHKIVDQPHREERFTKIVIAGKKPVEKINQPGCSREVQSISTSKVTTKCPSSNKEAVIENESVRSHKIVDQPHREERFTKIVIAGKKPVEKINQPGCSREVQSISTSKVTTKCPSSNKEAVIENESVRSHKIVDQPHREERFTKIVIAGKKPVEKINQPGCSREVQSISTSKVTTKCTSSNKEAVIENGTIVIKREPLSDVSSVRAKKISDKAAIQKGTKRPVSEKKDCTREITKHPKISTKDVAIKMQQTSDITTLKMLQGIKRRLETCEQYMARKGSSIEKEKAKSKERSRSIKKKLESGSSSSDSSRSSSESSSSSGSKSSSSSSTGSSSRSSSSSSDSSSSRNRTRRTKQRSSSKPLSARKSVDKDKKDKIKEKENDLNKDKDKDAKSKAAAVSDKKTDAKHRSRSRSSHRKKRHRSPTPRPTKIHIGRLTRTVNREHIFEIFGAYGVIKNVEFPKDHVHSHIGRGYAYVEYSNADEAEDAMKHMDGGQIDGQEITAAPVLIPKPRPYMPRRSPMPMRRPPMRRPPPHFRRRSPLRPPRRSPPRRRPRSRNSLVKRRKRSRSSSSSSR